MTLLCVSCGSRSTLRPPPAGPRALQATTCTAPRSGLAVKHFIDVGAGVIDEDYRGNVGVVLFNFGKEKFEVKKGDRIAQLICERILYPDLEEVQTLDNTERGSGGFGSTGKN
ncbi:deoxyuridine 5'-triphosphate nucleotidohydrolase isoform X12 [Rattus norvegicus]|uniref:deoxyuridine 5'-triphosphate nucleotidohydrolase isoform X12 n=1 Tax=Rattus norvegicus TaxID=10116 RepID=UPI001916D7C0|nr:deoxyuridine 5'-triphosphate nucleotidohydrolase isoform X2 [Rattus norvegicus]XP_038961578.1 deoxyuridine 5'-triphosphate nucleotidohydrolase isoform X2 [Rattus norvegicus]